MQARSDLGATLGQRQEVGSGFRREMGKPPRRGISFSQKVRSSPGQYGEEEKSAWGQGRACKGREEGRAQGVGCTAGSVPLRTRVPAAGRGWGLPAEWCARGWVPVRKFRLQGCRRGRSQRVVPPNDGVGASVDVCLRSCTPLSPPSLELHGPALCCSSEAMQTLPPLLPKALSAFAFSWGSLFPSSMSLLSQFI